LLGDSSTSRREDTRTGSSDKASTAALTFSEARWDTSSDEDGETALATRRRVLGELADSGARTAITHGAGPHAFRVEHDGSGGFSAVEARV
jgi:hypothetical protein